MLLTMSDSPTFHSREDPQFYSTSLPLYSAYSVHQWASLADCYGDKTSREVHVQLHMYRYTICFFSDHQPPPTIRSMSTCDFVGVSARANSGVVNAQSQVEDCHIRMARSLTAPQYLGG